MALGSVVVGAAAVLTLATGVVDLPGRDGSRSGGAYPAPGPADPGGAAGAAAGAAVGAVVSRGTTPAPRTGTPVRDGSFEFTVTGMEEDRDRIGSDELELTAEGRFVLVELTVRNVGDLPGILFGEDQLLVTAGGAAVEGESEAALYLDDARRLLDTIAPGASVSGALLFDVPEDAEPVGIQLHGSGSGTGVEVMVPSE